MLTAIMFFKKTHRKEGERDFLKKITYNRDCSEKSEKCFLGNQLKTKSLMFLRRSSI